ncbi:DUF4132 domain-containing protein [Xenorhabdus sp. PB61.4]|uniref:DUF4132 domain-containing protein n=1 Tax=Xenorhabdus sp. PB61.4 TaxID=2788940 RepID=UPI001E5C5FBF|nr:DUF4132 domain-containing protein [Xenorhabdus sp. PB61.4]MCC8365619.1 DUF4132 domain-containing protein [Xenorhabdus sp. PB61.4]
MIKKLFDILSIFGKKDASATENYLQEALLPLATFEQTLPQKALDYILTGRDPNVLYELNKIDAIKAAVLFNKPGTLDWWYSGNVNTGQYDKVMSQSIKARHQLYAKVGGEFTAEQTVRFAKVIAAACQDINIKMTTTELPSWVLYLLGDAFHTTYENVSNLNIALRNGWTMALIAKMINEGTEKTGPNALFAIFDRKDIADNHTKNLNRLYKITDLKNFIFEHQDFVRQILVEKLSANGQVELVNYLNNNNELRDHFADVIVLLSTSTHKSVRKIAEPILNTLPSEIVRQYLSHTLFNGTPKQRIQAADLFARQGDNRNVLEEALKIEKSKSVIKGIESALLRFTVIDEAINQEKLELPSFTPLEDTPLPESAREILVTNFHEMLANALERAEYEIEDNKTSNYSSNWAQRQYKDLRKLSDEKCRALLDKLNGEKGYFNSEEVQVIKHKNRITNLPEFTLFHAVRLATHNSEHDRSFSGYHFTGSIPERIIANLELRHVEDVLAQCHFNNSARTTAEFCLESSVGHRLFPHPEKIWPFYYQNPDFIAEALGLMPNKSQNRYRMFEVSCAIDVLATYPALPTQFIPRIMELALGQNKTHRVSAQQLLERITNIHETVQEGLKSTKQEIRITTIEWLTRIKNPASIPHLYALLKKEKREIVCAALLTALEEFGEDISGYLSPEILLKEAQKGLKGKTPASLSWFNFNALPALTWKNKQPVDPAIFHWWVVLAVKLKMPSGNALLQRYIDLLSLESQQKIGSFILHSFVAQDVKGPSLEEAMDEAQREAPSRLNNYKSWVKRYPEHYSKYENFTLEQVIEEIKNEVLRRYCGSAISDKGMLALICNIEGHVAIPVLRNYMRDHYQRRAQIEAILTAISTSNDPLIIQLLLSLSRRYRTSSIQEKARELVTQIAERNGWSADELADRTIPSAGLNETGTLVLEYGERTFTARLNTKQKLALFNPEGKEIKALPAARNNESEEQIKETKKLFTASKKELKQVIELQTARLYEAMCAQRQWQSSDWQEYILTHPVMHKLIEQLVWQEVRDGEIINQFRPSDDGCLLNLDDDEISLRNDSSIQLAHSALVSEEDRKAWLAHFKDYKVKFLFSQMENKVPELDLTKTEIEDRKGWVTDTFTLRGILTKMGYQRGPIQDAGSFDHYYKHFSSLNYYVNIEFSGSYVPEENIPAVLFSLSFSKNHLYYWEKNNITLKDVPSILLAESYSDYLKLAESCVGFDPEWEKKTPW